MAICHLRRVEVNGITISQRQILLIRCAAFEIICTVLRFILTKTQDFIIPV